jgi:hypothetical protein
MASPSRCHLVHAMVFGLLAINAAANIYDNEEPPSPPHDHEDPPLPYNHKNSLFCQRTNSTQKLKLLGEVPGYDLYYSLTHPLK